MVVQSAEKACQNADSWTTCDPGMCLWTQQEIFEVPHKYPDATSQWKAAKYKHAGDRNPPRGFPVFWTGGGSGYGHVATSMGDGKVRSTDQQSNGKCATVTISEVDSDWGNLTYAGWTEDIGDVLLPYSPDAGPSNPNDVEVGDYVLVTATTLNGRAGPDAGAPVVTTLPHGAELEVVEVVDGWARRG